MRQCVWFVNVSENGIPTEVLNKIILGDNKGRIKTCKTNLDSSGLCLHMDRRIYCLGPLTYNANSMPNGKLYRQGSQGLSGLCTAPALQSSTEGRKCHHIHHSCSRTAQTVAMAISHFFPLVVLSQTEVGGCWDTRKDKKYCVCVCVCKVSVFIWLGVFWLLLERYMCAFLVWCDYLWSQLYSSVTIAKVPAVGAAQRDKTGKMIVSEAPLNIIRPWWMGSAVGFRTISLTIKHAWGESFITRRNKATLPSPRVSTLHGKSLFPWQPNWLSMSKEWGRRRRQAKRGSCVEAWQSTLTSTWPLGVHAILLSCSPGEEHWMVIFNETKTRSV